VNDDCGGWVPAWETLLALVCTIATVLLVVGVFFGWIG
jgi:hypothetical protein